MLSEKRQQELEEVLEHLRTYAPTKIALEVKKNRQASLDSLYDAYLAGRFELPENEIYQVGFRLAKSLGHTKVYAVDAEGRWYPSDLSEKEHQDKQNYFIGQADPELLERELRLEQLYSGLYAKKDELKKQVSLLDQLLFLNDPEILKTGHGHYLIGSFKMGEGDDYYGPDAATAWYNRNLRIFHNLLQLNEPGKDRLFLLMGAGHLPILDFLAASSPDLEKVELKALVRE